MIAAAPVFAEDAAAEAESETSGDASTIIVTAAKATRSATALNCPEIQKLLAGVSPFKAIQTLPGVM